MRQNACSISQIVTYNISKIRPWTIIEDPNLLKKDISFVCQQRPQDLNHQRHTAFATKVICIPNIVDYCAKLVQLYTPSRAGSLFSSDTFCLKTLSSAINNTGAKTTGNLFNAISYRILFWNLCANSDDHNVIQTYLAVLVSLWANVGRLLWQSACDQMQEVVGPHLNWTIEHLLHHPARYKSWVQKMQLFQR